jgi:CheY-like chemotaxis protein
MSLKLMHHPGCIAVLDDDFSYLEALSLALPENWQVALYRHSLKCIEDLSKDRLSWEERSKSFYAWINAWREGKPLLPRVLEDLLTNKPNYRLTKVLVVDYSMPGKNGLEVLKELNGIPAECILLTGMADEQLAVKAFNDKLIAQFIQKHSADVGGQIKQAIEDLSEWADIVESQTWRSLFSSEQIAVLHPADGWSTWC